MSHSRRPRPVSLQLPPVTAKSTTSPFIASVDKLFDTLDTLTTDNQSLQPLLQAYSQLITHHVPPTSTFGQKLLSTVIDTFLVFSKRRQLLQGKILDELVIQSVALIQDVDQFLTLYHHQNLFSQVWHTSRNNKLRKQLYARCDVLYAEIKYYLKFRPISQVMPLSSINTVHTTSNRDKKKQRRNTFNGLLDNRTEDDDERVRTAPEIKIFKEDGAEGSKMSLGNYTQASILAHSPKSTRPLMSVTDLPLDDVNGSKTRLLRKDGGKRWSKYPMLPASGNDEVDEDDEFEKAEDEVMWMKYTKATEGLRDAFEIPWPPVPPSMLSKHKEEMLVDRGLDEETIAKWVMSVPIMGEPDFIPPERQPIRDVEEEEEDGAVLDKLRYSEESGDRDSGCATKPQKVQLAV